MYGETRALEEERESLVKEVEAAEEMSPNLKRYWRRRAEEYKEEQFYMLVLTLLYALYITATAF